MQAAACEIHDAAMASFVQQRKRSSGKRNGGETGGSIESLRRGLIGNKERPVSLVRRLGIRFKEAKDGKHKYVAETKDGRKVAAFGAVGYHHFRDSVPKDLGGGKWTKSRTFLKNRIRKPYEHGDPETRKRYVERHSRPSKKYPGKKTSEIPLTPEWFALHFLW